MKRCIFLLLLVGFLGFCVFCYNFRTNYNVDTLEVKEANLEHDVKILSYALSIIPQELKNEVFFNSIKEKFPSVEKRTHLIPLIRLEEISEEKEEKEENGDLQDTKTVGDITESILNPEKGV